VTRRRRLLAAAGALLLAAGGLAACSGDDGPEDDDGGGEARPGRPVDGGTLRLGLAGPLVVDPVRASPAVPGDLLVLDLLHAGLTELDAEGRPQAGLAVTWSADPAFLTWRFTVDPSARFTSGRTVTADDVVASLQRVISGGDASVAALRLEDVQGFRPFLDGTAPAVAGLRAVDPTTVEIALDSASSVLPEILAAPAYGIVDPTSLEVVATTGDLAGLDLTGRWEVGTTEPGRLEVRRRAGAEGHLDAVELRSFPGAGPAYDAFEDGDVDWAPVPGDRYGDAVEDHGDDHFAPFHAELLLGLRVGAPTLASPQLRQAIAAAVDREAIVRAVYPEIAEPLTSVVPVGVPGRSEPSCTACGHDPVRARNLVEEAFPQGNVPQITIDGEASPAQDALAKIVAESLEAVGIPTVVRSRALGEYQRFIVSGGQELFTFGWVGGYASPDAYLTPLLRSSSVDNLVAVRDPQIDALLAQARTTSDPAVQAERWAAVEALALDGALVIPIAQFRTQVVVDDAVEGLRHAVDGTVDWARVWLADAG
jgi:oligopeptide transport system substrate-binding protein